MLRGRSCSVLLSRLLCGQPTCQGALTSVCQQQQQVWKLARQITCSAAAVSLQTGQAVSNTMLPLQLGFAARFLSSAAQPDNQPSQGQHKKEGYDSLELTREKLQDAITDQIPQKPVTIVEGTSYMLVILGAFTVLGFFVYNFVTNFLLEPTYQTCFNTTLQKLKQDPRITVRLGNDIVGYGQESHSRVQRQQIPHHIYKDSHGVEHVRLTFNMRGPGGLAIVNADMFKDSNGSWDYMYLLVDVKTHSSPVQRLNIVPPKLVPAS